MPTSSLAKAWLPTSLEHWAKEEPLIAAAFLFSTRCLLLNEGQHMIRAGDFCLTWIFFLVERLQDTIFNQH